jgi:8-oxo-dGTP pyrophosphatase MutT (NUDIX family)
MPRIKNAFVVASMQLPFDEVLNKTGILALQNEKGLWELPGGEFDHKKDTSSEDTARRELVEEAGKIPGMNYSLRNRGVTKSGDTAVWSTTISRTEYKIKADRTNWNLVHKAFENRKMHNGQAEHQNIGFVYYKLTETGPKLYVLTATGKAFPNANSSTYARLRSGTFECIALACKN